jgi:hypothetical protein
MSAAQILAVMARLLWQVLRVVAEPGGAALSALLFGPISPKAENGSPSLFVAAIRPRSISTADAGDIGL